MLITGPSVIKQVTGEEVTSEQLGGPAAQMNRSGVVHLIAEDDTGALDLCRRLLSFLPSNNLEETPRLPYNLPRENDPDLNHAVPVDAKIAYDVRTVISRVLDYQDFFEIQPGFAANAVIGFGRIQGDAPSASWPINPACWRVFLILMRRIKLLASCASAMHSTRHW